MSRIELTRGDVDDIIQGATLLGSGGGGSPDSAAKIADDAFDDVETVTLISPDELETEDDVLVTGGMGSPESSNAAEAREEVLAIETYSENLTGPSHVVPFEIGSGNVTSPIRASATLNIPIVDGDGAGRAVPELQIATFNLNDIDIGPFAIADWKQNGAILYPNDTETGEQMSRALTVEFGSSAGFACYPMSGDEARRTLIPNTISLAREIGARMNAAIDAGTDVATTVADEYDGSVLARGPIAEITSETRDGFDVGRVTIADEMGPTKVDVKNENILVRRDGRALAMAPDLICWIDENGNALTNADLDEGSDVSCIALPAPDVWQSAEGLALFQPLLELFDYEDEYVPFSEL